jgi:hypothetical protein
MQQSNGKYKTLKSVICSQNQARWLITAMMNQRQLGVTKPAGINSHKNITALKI